MILLTGARGFLGRSIVNMLTTSSLAFSTYDGDIRDFTRLRSALADVETVIHLAGSEARGRTRWLKKIDIDGTDALIQALKFHSAKQIIVVSRLNAQPNSVHPLLRAKGLIEQQIEASGVPHTIIRCATLFGKNDRFTNAIATTAAWSWPAVLLSANGEVAMQPLWVEDAARCIVAAIGRKEFLNQTITLAGDERLHYRDIVKQVLAAARIRRRLVGVRPIIPRSINRLTAWAFYRPPITRFDHDRFTTPEVTDLDTVYTHFGFRPARFNQHLAHLRRPGIRSLVWRM